LIKYMAFDPGGTTGVAAFNSSGEILWMNTVPGEEVTDLLDSTDLSNCEVFIIEEYRIYPNKFQKHIYSSVETLQYIGAIKNWARKKNIKVVEQKANVKSSAYKWMATRPRPKSDPLNHALDAMVHGVFYLVKKKVIKPEDLPAAKNQMKDF
jgi:hypothetical protein